MPETKKGRKIKRAMEKHYGKNKGDQVFYASVNKGTVKGAHKGGHAGRRSTSHSRSTAH